MPNKPEMIRKLLIGFGFLLLSYPLFYYSYKFCLPDFGGEDFYSYYPLYKDWNFSAVDCPFNMRLISCFSIFLINKIGLYYNTEIVFTSFHPDYSQQVFFNAMLFNYFCVILTCFVIYKTVNLFAHNKLFSFIAACFYLLGFGTLFFTLKPMSESCGILLLSFAFYAYIEKKQMIYVVFLLAIFQREYIFIVFGIYSFIDYLYHREKYMLGVLIGSVICFSVYMVLRKTLFFTPTWDFQTSVPSLFYSLTHSGIAWWPFIKQTIFISNLFLIYLIVVVYKCILQLPIRKDFLIIILVLLVQVILMSIMAKFGNNAGRYFYYLSPILIYFTFLELKPLLMSYFHFEKHV